VNVWMSGALICALVTCATVTRLVCPQEQEVDPIVVGRLVAWAARQRVAAGHLAGAQVPASDPAIRGSAAAVAGQVRCRGYWTRIAHLLLPGVVPDCNCMAGGSTPRGLLLLYSMLMLYSAPCPLVHAVVPSRRGWQLPTTRLLRRLCRLGRVMWRSPRCV